MVINFIFQFLAHRKWIVFLCIDHVSATLAIIAYQLADFDGSVGCSVCR